MNSIASLLIVHEWDGERGDGMQAGYYHKWYLGDEEHRHHQDEHQCDLSSVPCFDPLMVEIATEIKRICFYLYLYSALPAPSS